jgi:hypothetical protein
MIYLMSHGLNCFLNLHSLYLVFAESFGISSRYLDKLSSLYYNHGAHFGIAASLRIKPKGFKIHEKQAC